MASTVNFALLLVGTSNLFRLWLSTICMLLFQFSIVQTKHWSPMSKVSSCLMMGSAGKRRGEGVCSSSLEVRPVVLT